MESTLRSFLYLISCFVLAATALYTPRAQARPEYAAKMGVNRCTMCHVSPVGGSIRNLTGKVFGARGFQLGPYSNQDLIYVDARAIYYSPENTNPPSRGGLAWMAGIVGANIPLTAAEDTKKLRLVWAQNLGGFSQAADRELYVRWEGHADSDPNYNPQYVLVGRFPAPFGIITDEHRIYTRLQTQTTWNNFEMGVLTSGNATEVFHYDLALVNGQNTAGTTLAADQDTNWGGIVNLRISPTDIPVLFGISASHHNNYTTPSTSAGVLYGLISLDRLKSRPLPSTILFEYARAYKMNRSLEVGFLDTSTTYDETIQNSDSEGILAQLNYDFSPLMTLILRYDQLILDVKYPKDAFRRYGVGIRHHVHANTMVQMRYEMSEANQPTQKNTSAKSAIDALYLLLQVAI